MSQAPVIYGRTDSVRTDALFCFDDVFFLPENAPGSHIRALRDYRYTYAVYYSADGILFEYELYDNLVDPGQLVNLTSNPTPKEQALWRELHQRLKAIRAESLAAPSGIQWPDRPS